MEDIQKNLVSFIFCIQTENGIAVATDVYLYNF